ncbi:STAS domain-containing protein, partial [Halomonas sp. BC04]|uniref:STAS domain-containing protein n=1 Tax=Halomonas sp. BC04 TaxID=1403540 RepID=UPI0005BC6B11
EVKVVMLDMRDVPSLDTTAIVALQSLIEELRSRDVGLIFIGMPARMVMKLRRAGLYREAGRLSAVRHLDHAQRLARHWLAERDR